MQSPRRDRGLCRTHATFWKVLIELFQKSMVACECRFTCKCFRRHPDAELLRSQHPKLDRRSPRRARRRETNPRRFCFFLRLLAQKEGKRFAQRIPQQYTPSKALGTTEGLFYLYLHAVLCTLHKNEGKNIYTLARLTLDKYALKW